MALKPQVIVGGVVGAALVVAGFVAPAMRSSASKTAAAALAQAGLAREALGDYDLGLPLLDARADLAALRQQNMSELRGSAADRFTALDAKLADIARQARISGATSNVPALGTDSASLSGAVSATASLVQANDAALDEALKLAHDADRQGGNVPGVASVVGDIEYLRAARALAEAQRLRTTLEAKQAGLLALALEWKRAQGNADYYKSLDFSGALEELREGVAEFEERALGAAAELTTLRRAIAERETELEQVRAELAETRGRLLEIETRGFTVGGDDSFATYRAAYREQSDKLRAAQRREQDLRFGALRGAELDAEDLVSGPLRGGELVEGLEKLRRRLVVAEQRAEKIAAGMTRLSEKVEFVTGTRRNAKEEEQRYETQRGGTRTGLDRARADVNRLAGEVVEKEKAAIQSAQAAVSAYRKAKTAIANRIKQARETRRERDPKNENARLKWIVDDRYSEPFGKSAEAAARLLEARAQTHRYEWLRTHIDALRQDSTTTGVSVDLSKKESLLEAARESAAQALNEATALFEDIVGRSPDQTKWIPQSSLAAVYYLLSKVEPTEADLHFGKAVETIKSALEGREHSPYLADAAKLRDLLKMLNPAAFGEGGPEEGDPEDDFSDDNG